ncbi:LOW QUALITY PROTEIN: metabotropic glutamate receptor 2-like [Rhinoderma darwinii]|uniref:LOW QUALITY PROTEIN: metabotropic glutamate receptor 2-like n=1 Tax=Rhinoderma darwinii TaxID=43563 RepID=UPI003F67F32F
MAALFWTLLSLGLLCSDGGPVSGDHSPAQELVIGGLFPVDRCYMSSGDFTDFYTSVQVMEAMRFAIEEINRNSTLLPGIKLVPYIRFFCDDEFIRKQMSEILIPTSVAAFIETTESFTSFEVLEYFQNSDKPVISCTTTHPKLPKGPLFLRMAPPAQYQYKAIVDILTHFSWTYVSVLSSFKRSLMSAMEEFKTEAQRHGICFAASINMCLGDKSKVISDLRRHPKANVVVLFVDLYELSGLLLDVRTVSFTWVVGITWGAAKNILETYDVPGRIITVNIQSYPLQRFNEHFQAEMEANAYNVTDPQFRSMFPDSINFPSFPKERNFKKSTLKTEFQPSPKVMFVVNAVYAIASALQGMYRGTCPNMSSECLVENKSAFITSLRNTSFTAPFTPPDVQYTVGFDHNGVGPARYNIFIIQKINGSLQYQQIGSWADELTLNTTQIMWESNKVPESNCGKPCGEHEMKSIDQANHCCWNCIKCPENEFLENEFTCKECDPGHRPNTNHSGCFKLPVDCIQWGDGLAIGSVSFSCLGILSTIFVVGVLVRNNNTPIVKASGREFCYILLGGVLLLYTMTFIFIARPSHATCSLRRLGLATFFAICYSALLTKTNRITRIFNSAKKGIVEPRYTSLASQVSICLVLISCQVLGLLIWLIIDPAEVIEPISRDTHIVLSCKSGDHRILISLVYNVLLILLCTVYAFKTRKYPENFNEAKCIGFTMYTTCIIWLAFLPTFYVTSDHPKVQITSLCVSVSLCATVILGGLFVPKLYIIFFHPEKNVKSRQCFRGVSNTDSSHGATFSTRVSNTKHISYLKYNRDKVYLRNHPVRLENFTDEGRRHINRLRGGDM